VIDLLIYQIDLVLDAIPTLLPHVRAGRLVAYVITGKRWRARSRRAATSERR